VPTPLYRTTCWWSCYASCIAFPDSIEGDAIGLIYEYFLGQFAFSEGHKGGEFFTPTSIVKLIVGIIEPYHGKIYDPACGSGGMFVQSAHFIERHRHDPGRELSIYGQEKTKETVRLAKMNLAVHGLAGDIREANSYYRRPAQLGQRIRFRHGQSSLQCQQGGQGQAQG
jgi:type I restriction-modification system DNA methylase subunit